jgi:hypothetical protein
MGELFQCPFGNPFPDDDSNDNDDGVGNDHTHRRSQQTGMMDWYLASRATVANWVLSPLAMKKAIATVQKGLKENRLSSLFNSSPRIVQSPKMIKETAAAIWMY